MGFISKIFSKNEKFNAEKYKRKNDKKINKLKFRYDMDSIKGIESIPVPKKKADSSKISEGVTVQVEYILQRKATEHKKNGKMDLAIACLRKSNEIMPFSPFFYTTKDYMRLVEFLKQAGKFDLARQEEEKINAMFFDSADTEKKSSCLSGYYDKNSPFYGSDLIETDSSYYVCDECAKYKKRIFSEYGFDKRYPKLPDFIINGEYKRHEHCGIMFYPYIHGVSIPSWDYEGDLINYINRPYIDERSSQVKKSFADTVTNKEKEKQDRKDFDFIREFLPEVAPKSFGGYRKMKKAKSKNYEKIVNLAKEKNYKISDF